MQDFKSWFKKELSKDGESVKLIIKISDDLQALLKKCVISEDAYFVCSEKKYKRYKIKSVVFAGLYSSYKEALFIKELIDDKKTSIKLNNMDNCNSAISGLKDDIASIIKNLITAEVEQQITFKVKKE